jgi:hypothetical protein
VWIAARAKRLVSDALTTVRGLPTTSATKPLVSADSAFYNRGLSWPAVGAGADVSVTVRLDSEVKVSIAEAPLG